MQQNVPVVVKIGVGGGLVLLAIAHALLIGGACVLMAFVPDDPAPKWVPPTATAAAPDYAPKDCVIAGPAYDPAPVNLAAQGEMKQNAVTLVAQRQYCQPCNKQGNPFNLRPGERLLHVGPLQSRPNVVLPPATSTPDIAPPQTSTERPPANQVQVLLFLDDTARSQEILQWFSDDPDLEKLKSTSDFQIYTEAHPLYRTRYASKVPVDQFPVVLVQDATGGHIHAAGKQFIPRTSASLVNDISRGYELYAQAKQGAIEMTGALKTTGYSWDDQVNPEMRLSYEDCDGPNCPVPTVRPSTRPGGGLFDGPAQKPRNILDEFGSTILQAGFAMLVICFIAGLIFVSSVAVIGFLLYSRRS